MIAALGAGAILGLTLHPTPDAAIAAAATPPYCLVCGDRGGTDVILNVLLFIPLGLGIRLAGGSWRRAVTASALLSLLVELLQLTVIAGRDASLSDLLSNTFGGSLGAALVPQLRYLWRPTPRAAWRLLLGGAAGWLALLGGSGWLQSPSGDGVLSSEWASGAPSDFSGRVLSATIDGTAMPVHGPLPDSAPARLALREGRLSLETSVVTGRARRGRHYIYLIREKGDPYLYLSQDGRSALFAAPTKSARLRLNDLTMRLPGAFTGQPEPVLLRAGERDRELWLEATSPRGTRRVTLPLSPAHGWAFVTPYNIGLGPNLRVITGLVLFCLVFPLGYWAGACGGAGALGILAAALVSGLGGVPALQGFPGVHWSEWVATSIGAAAGWALFRVAAYLQRRCGSHSISESS